VATPLSIVFLLAFVPWAAPRFQVPVREPEVLSVAGHDFRREKLENGLEVLAVRDADDATVSVFVVYGAGQRMEGELTTGLAHLTEHAMYTGTARTGADKHDARVRELGGESNAFTREDYTLFYDHHLPAAALDEVLAMEADRMRGITFDARAFVHERSRLEHEEETTYTGAMERGEALEALVFQRHPYGAGVLVAKHTCAPRLPIETVHAFYDTWYRPDHAAVVVVGPGDPAQAAGAIRQAFGALEPGPEVPPIPEEPFASPSGEVRLPSTLTQERVVMAWVGPALHEAENGYVDRLALQLCARALVDRALDSKSNLEAQMGERIDRDLFTLATAGAGARERLESEVTELRGEGIAAEALEKVKARVLADFRAFPLRSRPYFALAGNAGVYAALGEPEYLAHYEERIAAIGVADVRAAVQRWLGTERATVVRFQPDAASQAKDWPKDNRKLLELAQGADESGDLPRAIAAYQELLERQPSRMNQVIYLYSLGDLRLRSGDLHGSKAELERALAVVEYPAVRELLNQVEERLRAEEPAAAAPPAAAPQSAEPATAPSTRPPASDVASGFVPSGLGVRSNDTIPAAFASEAAEVMASLERWRGLVFLHELDLSFVPASQSHDKLKGWYDPDTRKLVVVDDGDSKFARGTMLHEMMHALQDQHFDLARLQREAEPRGKDASRSLSALIEGEAMLAVAELMNYDFESHASLPATGALDEARFEKLFNYGAGMRFVRSLREAGGWAQVDAAWRRPPSASAEVLHPDRWLAGVEPRRLDAADFGLAAEAAHGPFAAGGEYGLSLFLARCEATRADSARLSARLAGDLQATSAKTDADAAPAGPWLLEFYDELGAQAFVEACARTGAGVTAHDLGHGRVRVER